MQGHTITRASWFSKYVPKAGDDCVLWFPGQDDEQSSTIRDRSGQGNNGTITGATWTRLPRGLWVLSFDGTDDNVDCGNDTSLQITNNLSFECWFKTPSSFGTHASAFIGATTIASKYNSTGNQRSWLFHLQNVEEDGSIDNLTINLGDPSNGTFEYRGYYSINLSVSTWYHLVMTFASGTLKLYVNGTAVTLTTSSGAVPATLWNSTSNLTLGELTPGGAEDLAGLLGLVRLYEINVLSAGVVSTHYRQERHLFGV